MPKRKHLILFTMVIAIAALFAATGAMAFCTNCDPIDPPYVYDGSTVYGDPVRVDGWIINFLGIEIISREDCGVFTVPGSLGTCTFTDSECFKWHYEVFKESSDTISGLNFFSIMIPDCCPGPLPCTGNYVYINTDDSTPENLAVYGVAEGEPSVDFGQYNESGYVIRGTPDNRIDLTILTNTNTAAVLPGILKVKKAGVLPFEITGPGCPSSARSGIGAFSTGGRCLKVAEVTAGAVYLSAPFKRGCAVDDSRVQFWIDTPNDPASGCDETVLGPTPTDVVPVPKVKYCGGLEPGCPQCVRVKTKDNYTCVQYTAETVGGNKRFQQCINPDGSACDWDQNPEGEPEGCAAVFKENVHANN
jgi:WD40 repeat protein